MDLGLLQVGSSAAVYAKLTDSVNNHCNLCSSFKNVSDSDIVKEKEKYESIKNKVFARENKQKDEQKAQKIRIKLL